MANSLSAAGGGEVLGQDCQTPMASWLNCVHMGL